MWTERLAATLVRNGIDVLVYGLEEALADGAPMPPTEFDEPAIVSSAFQQHHANDVSAVLCNGEYGLCITHPRAACISHGNYFGRIAAVQNKVTRATLHRLQRRWELQRDAFAQKTIVAVSNMCASELREAGITVDTVINNAVPPTVFHPKSWRGTESRTVLCPTRYVRNEKGIELLRELEAYGWHPVVPTDNPAAVSAMGITALPWLSEHALVRLYQNAGACVFPSLYEGGSLAMIEAATIGTPFVSLPTGNAMDFAHRTPSVLVNTLSTEAFHSALSLVASCRECSVGVSDTAQDIFSYERWCSNWCAFVTCLSGARS